MSCDTFISSYRCGRCLPDFHKDLLAIHVLAVVAAGRKLFTVLIFHLKRSYCFLSMLKNICLLVGPLQSVELVDGLPFFIFHTVLLKFLKTKIMTIGLVHIV